MIVSREHKVRADLDFGGFEVIEVQRITVDKVTRTPEGLSVIRHGKRTRTREILLGYFPSREAANDYVGFTF